MLSEIYPGSSPKVGSTYWDQIQEVGLISVSRRVLKRLHEFLEQVWCKCEDIMRNILIKDS